MELLNPTTLTDNSDKREPSKMVNQMELSNPTTPTDNSKKKKPTKMVNQMDFGNPTTKMDNPKHFITSSTDNSNSLNKIPIRDNLTLLLRRTR